MNSIPLHKIFFGMIFLMSLGCYQDYEAKKKGIIEEFTATVVGEWDISKVGIALEIIRMPNDDESFDLIEYDIGRLFIESWTTNFEYPNYATSGFELVINERSYYGDFTLIHADLEDYSIQLEIDITDYPDDLNEKDFAIMNAINDSYRIVGIVSYSNNSLDGILIRGNTKYVITFEKDK